tara:strand:+ start:539 stop:778 length:240 start_codon:yes stop_codon:yes gene_type:complete
VPKYKGKHFSYTPSGLMNFTSSKIDDLEKKKKLTNKEEEKLENLESLFISSKKAYFDNKKVAPKRTRDKILKMEKKGLI